MKKKSCKRVVKYNISGRMAAVPGAGACAAAPPSVGACDGAGVDQYVGGAPIVTEVRRSRRPDSTRRRQAALPVQSTCGSGRREMSTGATEAWRDRDRENQERARASRRRWASNQTLSRKSPKVVVVFFRCQVSVLRNGRLQCHRPRPPRCLLPFAKQKRLFLN